MTITRVQTLWTGVAGSPYYTNLYANGSLVSGKGQTLATAWHTALASLTATLKSGLVASIDSELLEIEEVTGAVTGAGTTTQTPVGFTGTGDALPPTTQLLIRWSTNGIVHNRRVRGRTFLPGGTELHNNPNGTPASQIGTPVGSALDALLVTMAGGLVIWSQPFAGSDTNPARPGSQHPVSGFTMAPFWGSLRSRRD